MAGKAFGGEARSHVSKTTATGTITRRLFVSVASDCAPSAGAGVLGVALFSAVTGQDFELTNAGVAVVTAHETLVDGDPVTPHTDGTAKKATGSDVIAGRVLPGGGGVIGDDIRVLLGAN